MTSRLISLRQILAMLLGYLLHWVRFRAELVRAVTDTVKQTNDNTHAVCESALR